MRDYVIKVIVVNKIRQLETIVICGQDVKKVGSFLEKQ